MIDPATGKPNEADPRRATVLFTPDEAPCYTGLRIYRDQHAVLATSLGDVEFRLRPDQAPNTVATFRALAAGGFYTDVIFHRIAAVTRTGDPFVVQVGDPSGTGDGGPGFNIDLEDSRLPHDFGVLSMARNTDPNTNGSQVFICLSRAGTARLDGRYTAFAQAVRGAEVILALAASPVREGTDRPVEPPVLHTVKLTDAPPYGQAPPPVTRPASNDGRR
ncbi:MAG: peptidylprolyl isomerase [Leptolyngbya sp. PLA1]|nr:peptidylprolyl isomerase [Leptolyngbya sp. PLA1]